MAWCCRTSRGPVRPSASSWFTIRAGLTRWCSRPPWPSRHARCAICTSTAGRSNSSRSPPSRCSARLAPSSRPPRPASASQNWRCWPARSSPISPPPSPPSPPAPGIAAPDPPRDGSDATSLTPFSRLPFRCQTVFAKKTPSPPTYPRGPGANDALAHPSLPLRAHPARLQHRLRSPNLPETRVPVIEEQAAGLLDHAQLLPVVAEDVAERLREVV